MKKSIFLLGSVVVLAIVITVVLILLKPQVQNRKNISHPDHQHAVKKKVLFVNSYHAELGWSRGIIRGVLDTFKIKTNNTGQLLSSNGLVDLEIIHMDTKRNKSVEYIKKAALIARSKIEEWEPDVVIAADDNASKYLIVPYYKDNKLPFVFCGVNWDATAYGFPFSNVTGMIEVNLVDQAIKTMNTYAKGNKVGILTADTLTGNKEARYMSEMIGGAASIEFVTNFNEWKKKYVEMQHSIDILVMVGINGINDWISEEAKAVITNETKIPSAIFHDQWAEYTLFTFSTSAEEQGIWAARAALEILEGKSPSEIPIVRNRQAKIYLNMALAKKMGITFPMELIDQATFVSEK